MQTCLKSTDKASDILHNVLTILHFLLLCSPSLSLIFILPHSVSLQFELNHPNNKWHVHSGIKYSQLDAVVTGHNAIYMSQSNNNKQQLLLLLSFFVQPNYSLCTHRLRYNSQISALKNHWGLLKHDFYGYNAQKNNGKAVYITLSSKRKR